MQSMIGVSYGLTGGRRSGAGQTDGGAVPDSAHRLGDAEEYTRRERVTCWRRIVVVNIDPSAVRIRFAA